LLGLRPGIERSAQASAAYASRAADRPGHGPTGHQEAGDDNPADADERDGPADGDGPAWTQTPPGAAPSEATPAAALPVPRDPPGGEDGPGSGVRVRPPRRALPSLLLTGSGLVVVVAATMRWSTLATSDERRTFTGLTLGDGRVTLLLGLALALLGLARLARRRLAPGDALLGPVLAGLAVVLTGSDLLTGPPTLATFRGISADQIAVRPEAGLYLSLAAGAVALLAALALARGEGAGRAGQAARRADGGDRRESGRGGHRAGHLP